MLVVVDGPAPDLTVIITRMDGGPDLVIRQAGALAHDFFTKDDSSVGPKAYDAQVGRTPADRITTADIVAINTTMRARSPHTAWQGLLSEDHSLTWLQAIPVDVSLFRLGEDGWDALRPTVAAALDAMVGPYRNLSVATKVLHLKRPALFPVLDSLVVHQVGGSGRDRRALMDHLRHTGRANLQALGSIAASLAGEQIVRTEVRILDALLWSSHPAAGLAPKLGAWQHAIEPKPAR